MKLKTGALVVIVLLIAIGSAHASCVKCINGDQCTLASPNGFCACFFGDNGCVGGGGLCKDNICVVQVAKGASCRSTGTGPDFAADKRMQKALIDEVAVHSHTFAHFLEILLPRVAVGDRDAGGYIKAEDRSDETETSFTVENGKFTFTLDHPVFPDASGGPTRLVVVGHDWKLSRDSIELASGTLSDHGVD